MGVHSPAHDGLQLLLVVIWQSMTRTGLAKSWRHHASVRRSRAQGDARRFDVACLLPTAARPARPFTLRPTQPFGSSNSQCQKHESMKNPSFCETRVRRRANRSRRRLSHRARALLHERGHRLPKLRHAGNVLLGTGAGPVRGAVGKRCDTRRAVRAEGGGGGGGRRAVRARAHAAQRTGRVEAVDVAHLPRVVERVEHVNGRLDGRID